MILRHISIYINYFSTIIYALSRNLLFIFYYLFKGLRNFIQVQLFVAPTVDTPASPIKKKEAWIQILATFPSRIYRREVKSTLTQKPFGRPWVRLATCIVCFAWFRSDHVQRVHRVQHEVCSVCWSALLAFTSPFGLFAHTPWLPGTRLSGSNPRPRSRCSQLFPRAFIAEW